MITLKDRRIARVARACFAGGAVTTALLIMFVPDWGFLKALALGFPTGALIAWLGYNLREVWRAMGKAWQATREELPLLVRRASAAVLPAPQAVRQGLADFFAKPRPLFWIHALVGTVCASYFVISKLQWTRSVQEFALGFSILSVEWMFMSMIVVSVLVRASLVVHKKSRDKWEARLDLGDLFLFSQSLAWREVAELGGDMLRNLVLGALIAIGAVLCSPGFLLYFGGRYFLRVLRIVHSDERTICAINGPLGGILAFLGFQQIVPDFASASAFAKLGVVLAGGGAGVVLGLTAFLVIGMAWLGTIATEAVNGK